MRELKLVEKFRRAVYGDEVQVEEQAKEELARMDALVGNVGYPHFRKWLVEMKKDRKPQPGEKDSMLHAIGVIEGIELVESKLDMIEKTVREARRVG